jgi:hypothetical protein
MQPRPGNGSSLRTCNRRPPAAAVLACAVSAGTAALALALGHLDALEGVRFALLLLAVAVASRLGGPRAGVLAAALSALAQADAFVPAGRPWGVGDGRSYARLALFLLGSWAVSAFLLTSRLSPAGGRRARPAGSAGSPPPPPCGPCASPPPPAECTPGRPLRQPMNKP